MLKKFQNVLARFFDITKKNVILPILSKNHDLIVFKLHLSNTKYFTKTHKMLVFMLKYVYSNKANTKKAYKMLYNQNNSKCKESQHLDKNKIEQISHRSPKTTFLTTYSDLNTEFL